MRLFLIFYISLSVAGWTADPPPAASPRKDADINLTIAVLTRNKVPYYRAALGIEWTPTEALIIGLTAPLIVNEGGLYEKRYDSLYDPVSLLRFRLRWPGGLLMLPQQAVNAGPLLQGYDSRFWGESLPRSPLYAEQRLGPVSLLLYLDDILQADVAVTRVRLVPWAKLRTGGSLSLLLDSDTAPSALRETAAPYSKSGQRIDWCGDARLQLASFLDLTLSGRGSPARQAWDAAAAVNIVFSEHHELSVGGGADTGGFEAVSLTWNYDLKKAAAFPTPIDGTAAYTSFTYRLQTPTFPLRTAVRSSVYWTGANTPWMSLYGDIETDALPGPIDLRVTYGQRRLTTWSSLLRAADTKTVFGVGISVRPVSHVSFGLRYDKQMSINEYGIVRGLETGRLDIRCRLF